MDTLIDDFSNDSGRAVLGTRWRVLSDAVMGGMSQACVEWRRSGGRNWMRLSGDVRVENNGGFVQAGLDLCVDGSLFDASRFDRIRLLVKGNGETYGIHLRTDACVRPWQSYRAEFEAQSDPAWVELQIDMFKPHRIGQPLDARRLRRISIIAIGRPFFADLWIGELSLCEP